MKELSKILMFIQRPLKETGLLSYVYVYYLIMIMETLNRI